MRPRVLIAVLVLTLVAGSAAVAKSPRRHLPLPDGWQPEGIAAGPGHALYVGSIPTGAILRLDPRTGRTKTVVPGRDAHAATGIELRGRTLLAAGGMTGNIYAYDRRTGAERKTFAVGGGFVNDIARTGGDFYVTDSRKAQLYRVAGDLSGVKTVPTPDIPIEEGNNLNGIEATRSGRLLAVQSNTGALWNIDPATGDASRVDLNGAKLTNGDGMLLRGRTLLVSQNQDDKLAVVHLNRRFTAGEVKRTITSPDFDVPTTLARQGRHLYAVNARFGTDSPESAKYWVTRVR